MNISHRLSISAAAFLIGLGAAPALAQTTTNNNVAVTPATTSPDTLQSSSIDEMVDRDLNQQNRIEQGLKSGALTDNEAARLERGEARIDRIEDKDLKNGQLSPQELSQIQQDQNAESQRIYQLKHNATTGTTNTASTNRLEADVQRDINQQTRIDQGVDNGSLSATEVGNLEGGQARDDRDEARAARNGFVSANEQTRIQGAENVQSTNIYDDKHNNVVATSSNSGNGGGTNPWRDRFNHHDGFDYGDRDGHRHFSDGNNDQDNHDLHRVGYHDRDDHHGINPGTTDQNNNNNNSALPLTGNMPASDTTQASSSTNVTAGNSASVASGNNSTPVAAGTSPSTSVTAGATAPVTAAAATSHVTPPVVHAAPVVHAHK